MLKTEKDHFLWYEFEKVKIWQFFLQQIQRDAEVAVEDEQVFLLKQQTTLNKTPAPGPGGVGTLKNTFHFNCLKESKFSIRLKNRFFVQALLTRIWQHSIFLYVLINSVSTRKISALEFWRCFSLKRNQKILKGL